ncbi:hypothetical protein ACFCZ3_20235 [Cellulosimicrobium cellulans]|uniref:hypothetical protein n=1 Tax=Cellulosimicrobium cellulans TaxID=1710 RepID=UPI0035DDA857
MSVRYFANPSTPGVRDAMRAGLLDMIATPKQGNRVPDGVAWCADNGCFGKGYPGDDAWLAWLASFSPEQVARCRFAVAPDVVGQAWATQMRSMPFLPRVRALGFPVAYVVQDGARGDRLPWGHFDALFVGGTTDWKLGETARALVYEAKRRGLWVHMGRVNSGRRLRYADAIECDSTDGTFLAYGPDENLPRVESWLRSVNDQEPLDLGPLSSVRRPRRRVDTLND